MEVQGLSLVWAVEGARDVHEESIPEVEVEQVADDGALSMETWGQVVELIWRNLC